MDASFWHERWTKNEIPFHEPEANPLIVNHFHALGLAAGSRVLLPLCGKTLDMGWLLSQGYRVAGAELSELAIQQLFTELDLPPTITELGAIKHYHAPDIDIFVGNVFDVTAEMVGKVDAIFDRAALVALPPTVRGDYTRHIRQITDTAPQLLITYEYPLNLIQGPPFSISEAEIRQHYADSYEISLLARLDVTLRKLSGVKESVWHLKPHP